MRWCFLLASTIAIAAPGVAFAQEASPPPPEAPAKPGAGFGRRASFAFTLENLVGFVSESTSGDRGKGSSDQNGLFPGSFGPTVGFHHIDVNGGLTYGIGLGLAVLRLGGSSSDSASYLAMSLLPRLGYAGSLSPRAGFWIRGGPSVRGLIALDNKSGDSSEFVGFGGEAYLVFTPTDHVGVTVGPAVDFGIVGDSGGHSNRFTSLGLEVGLLADL